MWIITEDREKAALLFFWHKLCVILTPSSETEGIYFRYLRYFNLYQTVNARLYLW